MRKNGRCSGGTTISSKKISEMGYLGAATTKDKTSENNYKTR